MNENNALTIPEFQKDDFLGSTVPFEWILTKANGNELKQEQLVQAMAKVARQVGITSFKTMFKAYKNSIKGNSVIYAHVMDFSGISIMWDTGEWKANDNGVYKEDSFGNIRLACPHPIFILTRFVNVDTNIESVALVYGRPGRDYKTKIVPRSDLASATKIVKLAEYGVGVTSENARNLVQYLSDFENINYFKIAEMKSCDHMGWVGSGYKQFAPYISELEIEGQDDKYKMLFDAVSPTGTYDTWLDCIREYRRTGNKIVRIVMASAFASVLLKPLSALPFFVHMWGDTESGKTVALMAAVSIWANPVMGKYIFSFNSTPVGHEMYASCVNSLPLCMDELQIINKKTDFDDIIYRLCEGTGRLRGSKEGGIQKILTWHNCILTTGEKPITTLSSGGGALNRVIEIECNCEAFFKDARKFLNIIRANYGHAGKAFIDTLIKDNNIEVARGLHEKYIKLLEDNTEATDKQIASAAAILTADELSEQWIFNDGKRLTVEDLKPYLQTKEALNVNRRAYEYLREEIIANYNNFTDKGNECWGKVKDGYIYILKNRFNSILADGDFNSQSTLSWMARNGKLAKTDGRHFDVKVSLNGGKPRCVCLYEDDGEFTDVDNVSDEDMPF